MKSSAFAKGLWALVGLLACAGCGRPSVDRVEWLTMGTVAAVQTHGEADPSVLAQVKEAFARVERRLNLHDAASELNQLAGLSEAEILKRCDPEMRPCYERAFALTRQTDGAFNPRWRGTNTLDLGAIAKGFAVDLAVGRVTGRDALVDLGGNLRCAGGDWKVGVKGVDLTFDFSGKGACATSAEYYRGKHICDGRTGQPVTNGVRSVTVIHESAMLADGLSTVCFILGPDEGRRFLAHAYPEAAAAWALKDGSVVTTAGFPGRGR